MIDSINVATRDGLVLCPEAYVFGDWAASPFLTDDDGFQSFDSCNRWSVTYLPSGKKLDLAAGGEDFTRYFTRYDAIFVAQALNERIGEHPDFLATLESPPSRTEWVHIVEAVAAEGLEMAEDYDALVEDVRVLREGIRKLIGDESEPLL